jgi:RecB family exonuclease
MPIHVLLGKTRWQRRKSLPATLLSSVDDTGRPNFLYLTDTHRKASLVERQFVDRRPKPVFAPTTAVASALWRDLWLRHGDGRAILSRRALDALARRMFREGEYSWLSQCGPPERVAPAVSGLLLRLDEQVGGRLELPTEAKRAVEALRSLASTLPHHILPGAAMRGVLNCLGAPSPALSRWLRRAGTLIVDDILSPSPLATQLLLTLCRAVHGVGQNAVLAFETGRDLGGREAGLFFEYEDVDDIAFNLKPFASTRNFRRAVFEELVATGEANIRLAGVHGITDVEPWTPILGEGPSSLSDRIYTPGTPTPVPHGLQLTLADDPEDEVRCIARAVKSRLLAGAEPPDCLVALPDLGRYAELVRHVFTDHGIPYTLWAGDRLAWQPCARSLLEAADALEGHFGVSDWADTLAQFPRRGAAEAALELVLRQIARELAPLPGPFAASELAFELAQAVERGAYHAQPPSVGSVAVVGLLELRGLTPKHTWLGGLVRGSFPRPEADSWIVDARTRRRMAWHSPLQEARFLFCSLLRNFESDPSMQTLSLSWPATNGTTAATPSTVLVDLLDVPLAEGTVGSECVASPNRDGVWSHHDVVRRASDPVWRELLSDREQAHAQQQELVANERLASSFGAYDGLISPPPALPRAISVTALETYLACPQRYLYSRLFQIETPIEEGPELDARERGTRLHAILERFLTERSLEPVWSDETADAAAKHLHGIAQEALADLEEGPWRDHLLQTWLRGLLDDGPAGLLRAWLDDERNGARLFPEQVETRLPDLQVGPVRLRGVVDRVDKLMGGGRLITDYKTGRPPTAERVARGLALQPVAYAAALAGDQPVAFSYYGLRRADQVARSGWVGDAVALDRLLPPAARRLVLSESGRGRILDHAAAAAHRASRGVFHPTTATPAQAGCSTCPYRKACRVDPARAHRIEGDIQRPLDLP